MNQDSLPKLIKDDTLTAGKPTAKDVDAARKLARESSGLLSQMFEAKEEKETKDVNNGQRSK